MTIVWTNTAEKNIEKISDYILEKFTKKEVDDFLDKVDKIIANVLEFPNIGHFYNDTIYRHILISKQTYLFYKIEDENIILITFFNNSQNPDKLLNILFS